MTSSLIFVREGSLLRLVTTDLRVGGSNPSGRARLLGFSEFERSRGSEMGLEAG